MQTQHRKSNLINTVKGVAKIVLYWADLLLLYAAISHETFLSASTSQLI